MIANTLRLEAQARDGATILSHARGGGILRTSRPFREGGAARVVVGQLGPGLMRGDTVAFEGRIARDAHLVVASQMATRVLSGPAPVTSTSEWVVESGATLELLAEPTLVAAGASYATRVALTLEPGARVVILDLVRREHGAALEAATFVRYGCRLALADVMRFAASEEETDAIGTLIVLGEVDADVVDHAADRCRGVRIGIGVLRDGHVLARVMGESVWSVRTALYQLRSAIA